MLEEGLALITNVGMLTFVVASMAAMGLGLTVPQILEPLRDARLVSLMLLANFVVVPLVAIAAGTLLPMDEAAATAVIIIGCCAGAPFLPKLAQLAKGDAALAVGVMVLLMVLTVAYAPVVVPLVVEGAEVAPSDIAGSLIVTMLIPLGIGLAVKARYADLADSWAGPVGQASTVALLIGMVAALIVTWQDIIGSLGSWIFIGVGIVLLGALLSGYIAGVGRPRGDRNVAALATAQRNIAAAIVVATSLGGDIVVLTLVGAIVIPAVLIVLAGEVGKRVTAGVE
jgi:BASS family bile acid:Na+ symporter